MGFNQDSPGSRLDQFDRYLGVDLGGGKGKTTALALVRATERGAVVADLVPRTGASPLYDAHLVEIVRGHGPRTALAIDAPLTLPPCLRCTVPVCPGQARCVDPAVIEMRHLAALPAFGRERRDSRDLRRGKPPVTPYTQRATEVYLAQRRGILPREALGQGMGPLTARAQHLLRALSDLYTRDRNLLEVYPKATLTGLGLSHQYKRHIHEQENRLTILRTLAPDLGFAPGVWQEACVQSDHMFDAVICAYTAYLWAKEGWARPRNLSATYATDGWIWAPPDARQTDEPADVRAAT